MRALGIDLGSKRIGIAVSDGGGTLATPLRVIERRGRDRCSEHRAIADLAAEYEVGRLVVGLPLSLDGSAGPAAVAARSEAEELASVTGLEVDLQDERLTTVTADQVLAGQGHDARSRRRMVDSVAASVLLQSWLDHRRMTPAPGRG